jgi:hypothetical protein
MEILSKNIASLVSSNSVVSTQMPMIKAAGDAPLFTNMKMIEDLGYEYPTEKSKEKKHFAIYECPFCHKYFKSQTTAVNRGATKSCGCFRRVFQKEGPSYHGMKHTLLYGRWCGMISRVSNPNVKCYKDYGGRGISVCDEWRDFRNFMKWALENGYEEGFDLEIDRINNDGNYEPLNCRFTTTSINARNKRKGPDYAIYPNGPYFYVLFNWKGDRHYFSPFRTKEEARVVRDEFVRTHKECY